MRIGQKGKQFQGKPLNEEFYQCNQHSRERTSPVQAKNLSIITRHALEEGPESEGKSHLNAKCEIAKEWKI